MVAMIQVNNLLLVVLKIFWETATLFQPDHFPTYCTIMKIKTCTRATLIIFLMVLTPKLPVMPSFTSTYYLYQTFCFIEERVLL